MRIEKLRIGPGDMQGGRPAPSPSWATETLDAIGPDPTLGPAGGIAGYVVALAGPFKDDRGQFTEESLRAIKRLWPVAGLPVHAQHPDVLDDRLLDFLGRATAPRLSTALVATESGRLQQVACVRATLQFDLSATNVPGRGDLAAYFLKRARTDPGSLSSSLVLITDKQPARGGAPDVWMPEELYASDIVSVGAAVDGLLSAGPDPARWRMQAVLQALRGPDPDPRRRRFALLG